MANAYEIPWKRICVEAVTIVGSILLAFAIDAWWEERQERDAELRQLHRVSAELDANAERIQRKLDVLADAIEGATAFMSWMGPSPVDILEDDYFSQWAELFSIGTFALLRNASEDFLAAGDTDSEVSADIRHAVSDWYSYGDDLEAQYALLRAAHADLGDYSMDIVPRLKELNAAGVTQSGLVSRFPFDIAAVLSDPNMESRLAIYLIRMEFVRRQALDLLERQAILKALVQQATGE